MKILFTNNSKIIKSDQNPSLINHNIIDSLCSPLISNLPTFFFISALLTTLDNSFENRSMSP